MILTDLISQDAVLPALKANGKKQALIELAHHAAKLTGLDERAVFDTLLQRERLGSTGIGDGIAIPHGKPQGLSRMCAIFARLDKPIDFEALDGQPVDLIVLLLAPEGAGADHLKALARVARVLRAPGLVDKLRATRDAAAIYSVLTDSTASTVAA